MGFGSTAPSPRGANSRARCIQISSIGWATSHSFHACRRERPRGHAAPGNRSGPDSGDRLSYILVDGRVADERQGRVIACRCARPGSSDRSCRYGSGVGLGALSAPGKGRPLVMAAWIALPLSLRLLLLGGIGLLAGALVNWAIYALAWFPLPVSPWSPVPGSAARRAWPTRIPVVGWWLRGTESADQRIWAVARFQKLGYEVPADWRPRLPFWLRPLLIE